MQLIIECTTEEQDVLLHDFCLFTCARLEIDNPPSFTFVEHTGATSFGSYTPSEEAIIVATEGRHTSDILRTLGHELVHHKQLSEGDNEMSLEELEYEANAVAGMLMRDYNKLHPEMFGLVEPTEAPAGSIGDSQGATFPDTTRPSGPIEMAEAKIRETDSDTLKLLKLQNQALRAFPSSPRQREIQKQIESLRKKMKTQGTPEYHTTLKEEGIVNAAGAGAVAGIGIGPQGEPGVSKKKKSPILQPMLKRFKALREEYKDTAIEARKKLATGKIPASAEELLARRKLVDQINAPKKKEA